MRWQQALHTAITAMLPWPAKHDRRAAVAAAAAEKERSQAAASASRKVREQISRLARENHYSEVIQAQIIRGHERGR